MCLHPLKYTFTSRSLYGNVPALINLKITVLGEDSTLFQVHHLGSLSVKSLPMTQKAGDQWSLPLGC